MPFVLRGMKCCEASETHRRFERHLRGPAKCVLNIRRLREQATPSQKSLMNKACLVSVPTVNPMNRQTLCGHLATTSGERGLHAVSPKSTWQNSRNSIRAPSRKSKPDKSPSCSPRSIASAPPSVAIGGNCLGEKNVTQPVPAVMRHGFAKGSANGRSARMRELCLRATVGTGEDALCHFLRALTGTWVCGILRT